MHVFRGLVEMFKQKTDSLEFCQVNTTMSRQNQALGLPFNTMSAIRTLAFVDSRSTPELHYLRLLDSKREDSVVEHKAQDWYELYLHFLGFKEQPRLTRFMEVADLPKILPVKHRVILQLDDGHFAYLCDHKVYTDRECKSRQDRKFRVARYWLDGEVDDQLQGTLKTRLLDADGVTVVPENATRLQRTLPGDKPSSNSRANDWRHGTDSMIRDPQALGEYAFMVFGFGNVWRIDDSGSCVFEVAYESEVPSKGIRLPVYYKALKCSQIPLSELAEERKEAFFEQSHVSFKVRERMRADAVRFMHAGGMQFEELSDGVFYVTNARVSYNVLNGQVRRMSLRPFIGKVLGRGLGTLHKVAADRGRLSPLDRR